MFCPPPHDSEGEENKRKLKMEIKEEIASIALQLWPLCKSSDIKTFIFIFAWAEP